MSGWNLVHVNELDKSVDLVFENCDPQALAQAIGQYFQANNYRLEEGVPGNAVYGIGSEVARIFLGALVKRYKFRVTVMLNGPQATARVEKAMSGAMGGWLGHVAMKKETKRVFTEIQHIFRGQLPTAT